MRINELSSVDVLNEISTELLGRYKIAAGKDASAADKAGDISKGNKRFKGIVKATKKQFDNDAKKRSQVSEVDDDKFNHHMANIQQGKRPDEYSQALLDCSSSIESLRQGIHRLNNASNRKYGMILSDALESILDIEKDLSEIEKGSRDRNQSRF